MEVIYLYDVDIRAIADRRIRDNLLISSLYEYVQAQNFFYSFNGVPAAADGHRPSETLQNPLNSF